MTERRQELEEIARAMVAEGQGILAADESNATMTKRLESVDVESSPDTRLAFRELLTATPDAGKTISGVILYDETIKQKTSEGTPFPEFLKERGMIPGIKVDTGAKELVSAPGEKITEGLDGLRERLAEYYELGARFAKWRGVIAIGDHIPSDYCVNVNAHALARYAALCQEAGIVPIVEPEVLMDGDHTIDRSEQVTLNVLTTVFAELRAQRVLFEGMILKPNMALSGYDCPEQATVQEVAERTLQTLSRTVPAAVPGIAFLSGGQSDELATEHLNAMNAMGPHPWGLTFSYGRALQAAPLKVWAGQEANADSARAVFALRARCNGAAAQGQYSQEMEKEPVG